MEWFRAYHGISTDAKWRLVARMSKQPVAVVLAVWVSLLDYASQADARGSIAGVDCELLDVTLDLEDGVAQAVVTAMESKGLVEAGRIAAWDRRQVRREDSDNPKAKTVAQRVAEHRARKRAAAQEQEGVTQCNARVTQRNAQSHGDTNGNAPDTDTDTEKEIKEHTHLESHDYQTTDSRSGACVSLSPAPYSQEDIEEAKLDVRREADAIRQEFDQLRDAYKPVRDDGPNAGWPEYQQARFSKGWPGLLFVLDRLQTLIEQDAQWKRGYREGLRRFLTDRMWEMDPRKDAGQEPELTPEQEEAKRMVAEGRRKYEEKMAKLKEQRRKYGYE